MANPLYNDLCGNLQNGVQNQQPPSFQEQFANFARQFQGPGSMNPQAIVQQLLQSGRMTQEQFNQYSQMANFELAGASNTVLIPCAQVFL